MKTARLVIGLVLPLVAHAVVSHGFRVPDGFEVSVFADDDLAHDIFSMTTDREGRIVVASRGWIKTLHDTDDDGVADKAVFFAKAPQSGAQGMYFDEQGLIVSGDKGVRRWQDRNGDGRADGEPQLIFSTADGGEHGAHGIVKGPDGRFYLIAGNLAGIGREHAGSPSSPVRQVTAGAIVQFSLDHEESAVVAHGFRNPYDLAFHPFGQLLTYEADGERDEHLPWYSGTRLFDVAVGAEHGWILKATNHAWNRPESWFDNTARVVTVGRGSPTGVVVYRHRAFPQRYRNGVFMACWTFGRIYYCPLIQDGSTFRTQLETFMEPEDNAGFAPVDLVVGQNGELFVAMGGRGTRGTVYRVRYRISAPPVAGDDVHQVLAADQPLSSWSRRHWVPRARLLGVARFEAAARDRTIPLDERVRAIEILVELFGGLRGDVADALIGDSEPLIRSRVAWALRYGADAIDSWRRVAALTRQDNPQVARAAWESLLALPSPPADPVIGSTVPDWYRGLDSSDRRVRAATVLVARGPGFGAFTRAATPPGLSFRARLGILKVFGSVRADSPGWIDHYVETCLSGVDPANPLDVRLDALRLLQFALGDLRVDDSATRSYDGFTAMQPEGVPTALRARMGLELARSFPSGDTECDRELVRMLALLRVRVSELPGKIAGKFSQESQVEDDLFYLMAASHLPGLRATPVAAEYAHALALLPHKMKAGGKAPSRYWSMHVGDMTARLLGSDTAFVPALVGDAKFNLPEHALFGILLPAKQQAGAARAILSRMDADGLSGNGWTPELISLLTALPDEELLPVLRAAWEKSSLKDRIIAVLARKPTDEDRFRFFDALRSFQPTVVEQAARALKALPARTDSGELSEALRALRIQCQLPRHSSTRAALRELLEHWTGRNPVIKEGGDLLTSYAPWFDLIKRSGTGRQAEQNPAVENRIGEAWKERLARVDWSRGDPARGGEIFEARLCSRCHVANRLGPDLKGVTARFGVEDLFAAIVDPDRDISAAWEGRKIETRDGLAHVGVVVYESPEVLLLQNGVDSTLRLRGDEIISNQASQSSLMPAGLLEGLSDGDLANFYQYLKTLGR